MTEHEVWCAVARQPICDRRVQTIGYELLYRAADGSSARIDSGHAATAAVTLQSVIDIGLDTLIGERTAFVNVTSSFLQTTLYGILPPRSTVLELLEDAVADEETVEGVRRARAKGYRIALDDFEWTEHTAELLKHADIVKIDVLQKSVAEIEDLAARLERPGLTLLAEKVESPELFRRLAQRRFTLFQGYFFARPEVMRGRVPPASRWLTIGLIARLHDSEVDLEELSALVSTNVGVSYRLLRFANSALFGAAERIESIRHAVVMLGLERVRSLVSVILLASLDDKPHVLVDTALMRGRICRSLGIRHGRVHPEKCFTVGLFSVLDAFLDEPIESLLARLKLSTDLEAALLRHEGDLGQVLEAAIACERADWSRLDALGADPILVRETYLEAVRWTRELVELLAKTRA